MPDLSFTKYFKLTFICYFYCKIILITNVHIKWIFHYGYHGNISEPILYMIDSCLQGAKKVYKQNNKQITN